MRSDQEHLEAIKQTKINSLASVNQELDQLHAQHKRVLEELNAIDTLLGDKDKQSLSGFTMRQALMIVLSDNANGLTNKDIQHELRSQDFRYTAETPIRVRICNDLYRLQKQNKVQKHGKRYYITRKGLAYIKADQSQPEPE